jgi:citrate synthase
MTSLARTWITRADVLAQLGVKPQTLYAYVSRGRIAARPDPHDPRKSLYAAEDVARLLDRSARPSRPVMTASGSVRGEAVIESALTTVAEGRLYYRGEDAARLAETLTLEQVARLLWGAEEDPFAELKLRVDVALPGGPRSRAFGALARRAEEDAATVGRSEKTLQREAASVLNELVDAIAGGGPRLFLHQRLARVWKVQTDREAQLIRRALVLSAEQEFDAATLAARATASAGAPLAAAALSGLAALSGPQLGGKAAQVTGFVAEARRGGAEAAARQRLEQGLEIPGFGHRLYPDGDPRAQALLGAVELPQDLMDILECGERLTGQPANFDLALALVGRRLDLPKDAPFALYTVGRCVGWLAHALEQAASGSPIRARLRYVGPEPRAD